jgi:holliday junction DNA helicase RuvA
LIGYLRGTPLKVQPDSLLLDVGGVGYAVTIPLSTYYEIERAGGGPVALFIHTHLREDELALFGFSTELEKRLFERLITVSGVGPRLARGILSGLAPEELLAALKAGEPGRLVRIPGIGKRLAERLVVELKERLDDLGSAVAAAPTSDVEHDVVSALVNLGYKPATAEATVREVLRLEPTLELHQLLRASLGRLSKV